MTTPSEREQEPRDEVMEVAAYWAMRLSSEDCSAADRAACRKWREEHPDHEAAFAHVDAAIGAVERNIDDPDLLAYAAEVSASKPPLPSTRSRVAVGASLAAGLALAVFAGAQLGPRIMEPTVVAETVYRTAIGERSTTVLDDGSEITLNTATTLEVDYSPEERRIDLQSGQAIFKVAKDPDRPFVVVAGDKRIIAVGTEFDVRFDADAQVSVTLVEGKVLFDEGELVARESQAGEASKPIALAPGEQIVAAKGQEPAVKKADVARVVSWSEGRLVFENDPLANAVAEMNRYTKSQIALSNDDRLQAILVGGVFQTGRQETFLTALTTIHPVEVVERNDGALLVWRD